MEVTQYSLPIEPYRKKIMDYYYSDLPLRHSISSIWASGIWTWLEEEYGARRHYEPWVNVKDNSGHQFKFKTKEEMTFFILRWA